MGWDQTTDERVLFDFLQEDVHAGVQVSKEDFVFDLVLVIFGEYGSVRTMDLCAKCWTEHNGGDVRKVEAFIVTRLGIIGWSTRCAERTLRPQKS